jgi:hypothetical protein
LDRSGRCASSAHGRKARSARARKILVFIALRVGCAPSPALGWTEKQRY